jgi:hypothetical protein
VFLENQGHMTLMHSNIILYINIVISQNLAGNLHKE